MNRCIVCGGDEAEKIKKRFDCRRALNHFICDTCGETMTLQQATQHFPNDHYVVDLRTGASPFAQAVSAGAQFLQQWRDICAGAQQYFPRSLSNAEFRLITPAILLRKELQDADIVTETGVSERFSITILSHRRSDIGYIQRNDNVVFATQMNVKIDTNRSGEMPGDVTKEECLFVLELLISDCCVQRWMILADQKYSFECCFRTNPPFSSIKFRLESPEFPVDAEYSVDVELIGVKIGICAPALFITSNGCADILFGNDRVIFFPTNCTYSCGTAFQTLVDNVEDYDKFVEREFGIVVDADKQ